MSKSEDYLDDLLNSVSDANRRNNKKDIENLIQSMNEEAAKPREREKKTVEKKHEDYSGTGFLREFEQELATAAPAHAKPPYIQIRQILMSMKTRHPIWRQLLQQNSRKQQTSQKKPISCGMLQSQSHQRAQIWQQMGLHRQI